MFFDNRNEIKIKQKHLITKLFSLLQHMVFVKMLLAFCFYDYWNLLSAASGAAIFGQNVLIR